MPDVITEKLAGSNWNLMDFLAVGVSKVTMERLLTPMIGNGTVKSGVLKGVGGIALSQMVGNKSGMGEQVGRYVAAGLIVDAVEDVTLALIDPTIQKFLGGGSSAASNTMVDVISG